MIHLHVQIQIWILSLWAIPIQDPDPGKSRIVTPLVLALLSPFFRVKQHENSGTITDSRRCSKRRLITTIDGMAAIFP